MDFREQGKKVLTARISDIEENLSCEEFSCNVFQHLILGGEATDSFSQENKQMLGFQQKMEKWFAFLADNSMLPMYALWLAHGTETWIP